MAYMQGRQVTVERDYGATPSQGLQDLQAGGRQRDAKGHRQCCSCVVYVSAEARCIGDSNHGRGGQTRAAEQTENGNDVCQLWPNAESQARLLFSLMAAGVAQDD